MYCIILTPVTLCHRLSIFDYMKRKLQEKTVGRL